MTGFAIDLEHAWVPRLGAHGYARALAAAGVLAAIEATRASATSSNFRLMPLSAAELLRVVLAGLVDAESPLLAWSTPIGSDGSPLSWLPAPEILDKIWTKAFEARSKHFQERIVIDGQGWQRNEPPRTGVRLELPRDFRMLGDANRVLVGPDTDIEVASSIIPRGTPKPVWNWPLRVRVRGTPDVDRHELVAFRNAISDPARWAGDHVKLLPDDSRDRADFALLFAGSQKTVVTALEDSLADFNADCLIVTTPSRGDAEDLNLPISPRRMCSRFGAAGIVFQFGLELSGGTAVVWMVEFVRELSHAVTVDAAAMRAAQRLQVQHPVMHCSRALLKNAHVSRRQAMIVSKLEEAVAHEALTGISQSTMQALQVGPMVTPRVLAQALRERLTPFDFDRESSGAAVVASLDQLVERIPVKPLASRSLHEVLQRPVYAPLELPVDAGEPALPANMRFLQARLLRVQGKGLRERFTALSPCDHCFVRVRIGIQDAMWPTFGRHAFPTDGLPASAAGGWNLQVYVFTNAGHEALNASLFLPTDGDSEPVEFKCLVGDGFAPFRARIVVAYANRVLQSAWLEAPVKAHNGRVLGSFSRGIEAMVRQNLTGLDERSRYDAFLVVNDSLTNGPGVAIASGSSAVLRTPPDLSRTISYIDDQLTQVSSCPERYEGGLSSEPVVKLLRNLAQHGREMFEAIVEDQEVDRALVNAERIQVVAAEAWARLPIEFFYDHPAPDPEAPLCAGAASCLSGAMAAGPGPCNDECPAHSDATKVVCPRGFWGLRKIIEWHRHGGEKTLGGDFRLLAEPDVQRKSIKAFQSVLFAHSDRVDAHDPQASSGVLTALRSVSVQTNTAADWDLWRAGIKTHSPKLLVVLPHNEESANTLPELSIGTGEHAVHRLLLSSIDGRIVQSPEATPGTIVLLLGCETGAPMTSYLGYVPKLRRYGASIIVSTGAVVLGRQIAPLCASLITGLRDAIQRGPAPLGEVMLRLRREALAQGLPIVLALSASGDADWLIE